MAANLSDDGEILDETQSFVPGTQAFEPDQSQQTQAFDVTENSMENETLATTQAFDPNETSGDGDGIPSTQAFGMNVGKDSDENDSDDEDKEAEDYPLTQPFSPFEEADRIIGDKIHALHHPEADESNSSVPPAPEEENSNAAGDDLNSDVSLPPPRPSVVDFEAMAPIDETINATQAFETSTLQEDIGSPDYPVRDSTGGDESDLFSATQPFDAAAGPSLVDEPTVAAETNDDQGPRSPSPENQEVEGSDAPGPRSPTPLQDEPKSPDPESDEDIPLKSPEDHPSDDDDDDEIIRKKKPVTDEAKKDSDDSDSEKEEEEGGEKKSPAKKKRVLLSDDEDNGEEDEEPKKSTAEDSEGGTPPGSPPGEEGEGEEKEKAEPDEDDALIADIFGEEHEYEGEDDGRDKEDMGLGEGNRAGTSGGIDREDKEWDFDVMMKKKKSEAKRRRRRKDGSIDLQSGADEFIRELTLKMQDAAEEDRKLNKNGKPALKKRVMLNYVKSQLMKCDYRESLVDSEIISVLAEWLAPLPDKSLPALEIRSTLLKLLQEFDVPQSQLKRSGIGKAVMILYKHPRESKKNREIAGKLIGDWARPIFELETDYRKLSREDRERRDYDQLPESKKQRLSSAEEGAGAKEDERPLRPGDKGWIGRARVPQPSKKDYVVRPKSKVEVSMNDRKGKSKGASSALDKKLKEYNNRIKRGGASDHAVVVSIEGRKMQI